MSIEQRMCRLEYITGEFPYPFLSDDITESELVELYAQGYGADLRLRIVENDRDIPPYSVVLAKKIPVSVACQFAFYFVHKVKIFAYSPTTNIFCISQVIEIFNRWLVKYCTEDL